MAGAHDYSLYDYPTTDNESMVDTSEATHVTGAKNSGAAGRSLSVATYQWLIVIGALAALWALRFGFKSAITG